MFTNTFNNNNNEMMMEEKKVKIECKTFYVSHYPTIQEVFNFMRRIDKRIAGKTRCVDIVSCETGEVYAIRDELGLWENFVSDDNEAYTELSTEQTTEDKKIPEALENLAIDGFSTTVIHKGDIVRYPTEFMGLIPQFGEIFRVGPNVGTCIGVADSHVLMYVQ